MLAGPRSHSQGGKRLLGSSTEPSRLAQHRPPTFPLLRTATPCLFTPHLFLSNTYVSPRAAEVLGASQNFPDSATTNPRFQAPLSNPQGSLGTNPKPGLHSVPHSQAAPTTNAQLCPAQSALVTIAAPWGSLVYKQSITCYPSCTPRTSGDPVPEELSQHQHSLSKLSQCINLDTFLR